ncbi:MAG: ABC transporter substrate-binding protein [Verrucomicrobiota bacterium]
MALTLLSSSASEPFLRLRDGTLGYHGSETDLTNLTEIRIGWFGPTNVDNPLTGDLWWAANLAIREANAQVASGNKSSFQGLPLRLVARWAVDPWGSGVSQLTRMVYDEQPLALLGSVDSATTHLAEQVVAKANLPLVSPIATDKSITLAGVSWMFSCAPDEDVIARVLVADLLASLEGGMLAPTSPGLREESLPDKSQVLYRKPEPQKTSLALITCTDHESRMTAREVMRELSRRGRLPSLRLEVPPAAHEFSKQLAALQEARSDTVLIVAGPEDAAGLVRALRAAEPANKAGKNEGADRLRIFGSHAMSRSRFSELAGSAAEGVCFPLLFVPDLAHADTSRFLTRFAAERHRMPDYTAALTYDATRLLIEAIHRAGPNRTRIREELARLSPWSGIAGTIHFDGTGQNIRTNICMATIHDGTIVPVQRLPIQNTKNHNAAKL